MSSEYSKVFKIYQNWKKKQIASDISDGDNKKVSALYVKDKSCYKNVSQGYNKVRRS